MKLHWGHGILIFYALFVLTLVVVVIKSRDFDNSLVTEAYYARDLNYQQEYDRRLNSNSLRQPLTIVARQGGYALRFPQEIGGTPKGTVLLYRPSSRHDDRHVPLSVGKDGVMPLDVAGLKPGRYQAIVEWSAAGVDYYDELDLTVQP